MLAKSPEADVQIQVGEIVEPAKCKSSAWKALASLAFSILLSSLGTSIANVALPTLAQEFSASFQEVQWIVIAYLLAITTVIVSVGRLGDIVGRRRLLLAGIIIFTVASIVCGVAPKLWLLIVARAMQGLGAAVMMALTVALAGETMPKTKIGSAMGMLGAMSAIGTALGPSLGGVLIAGLGWRAIFFINVPLGLLTYLLARRYLPVDREALKKNRVGFDKTGTFVLALALAGYALAMTIGRGSFGLLNLALLLVAALGIGLFIFVETRAESSLVQLTMFRDPMLSASLVTSALVSTVMMATLVVGPFYLSRALKLDAALVGAVMSAGPIVAALMGVPAGRIVDRLGAQRMTIVGLIGIAVGSFILSMMPATLGIPGYVSPIVVMTAGYALFQTANNTAVMANIIAEQRGVISGMLNLSRNLGLITGASVLGAVFAFAAETSDITTAGPDAIATGMRITFAVSGFLILMAITIAIGSRALIKLCLISVVVIGTLAGATKIRAGTNSPAPDHYPLNAAGWGPGVGNGLFFSRWAEDWTGLRADGTAPPLKAVPIGNEASLTLSGETRLRYENFNNAPPTARDDFQQSLFRGILGADVRFNPNVRIYSEIGTGQVADNRNKTVANYQNDASLQQLFLDVRGHVGSAQLGTMIGRQEFADGPRQLISLSDGPNLHRSWNGVRLYAHAERFRVGAFNLRATRLQCGYFDEKIDHAERLQGLNVSLIVSLERNIFLDPLWIHSENPVFRFGVQTGRDDRDTYGARLWGWHGTFKFDWTLGRQTGEIMDRDIDAWGFFAVQSWALSDNRWNWRLTSHIDIASGGEADGSGAVKGFNPLYTSSLYLGEGRFLALANLLLIAPGISVSPTSKINLSAEYSFARRFTENDAVYAGGMRAYPRTLNVRGHEIGGLLRVAGTWSATGHLSFYGGIDHLAAGSVLKRAGCPPAVSAMSPRRFDIKS